MTSYIQGTRVVETPTFTGVITLTGDARIVADSYTETSGDVWSITNTPGSSCTADIVKITAAGSNWTGGSCLYLNSADASVTPLILNNAGTRSIGMYVSGSSKAEINPGAAGGLILKTFSNGNIQFLPNGTGITQVGDAGSTSHSLATNDDLFVSGQLEVDGTLYVDGVMTIGGAFPLNIEGDNTTLADDASKTVLAHASTSGWLHVQIGDDQEWARARFNSSGTVALEANSANVANSDSDTDLCIYSTGGNLVIKNRLGSSLKCAHKVWYYAV